MTTKIQLRRDTSTHWGDYNNPENKLAYGELGIEKIETNGSQVLKAKIGDGENIWSNLPYLTDGTNYETLENKPSINNVELIGNLTFEELGIAKENEVVHKNGNEIIHDRKEFDGIIVVPNQNVNKNSTSQYAANLKYVADITKEYDSNAVHKSGSENIDGDKYFSGIIQVRTPTTTSTSSQQVDTVGARQTELNKYQKKLSAGGNISIVNDVISAIVHDYTDEINALKQEIGSLKSRLTSSLGMPNYSAAYGISSGFVAPSAGWIMCLSREDNGQSYVKINGVAVIGQEGGCSKDRGWARMMAPINKSNQVTFSNNSCWFIPCY